jgi:hypothetical protein
MSEQSGELNGCKKDQDKRKEGIRDISICRLAESIAEIRVLPAGTGGLRNSVSFLQADPDIAVHASLLPSSSSHVFLEGLSRS